MKPKRQLEVGMRVEFETASTFIDGKQCASTLVGVVTAIQNGLIFVNTEDSTGLNIYRICRRQITKVWRKKPKRVPREIWVNEYSGELNQANHRSYERARQHAVSPGAFTIHFREVIE